MLLGLHVQEASNAVKRETTVFIKLNPRFISIKLFIYKSRWLRLFPEDKIVTNFD